MKFGTPRDFFEVKEVGTKLTDSFYCTSNYVPLLEAVWTHGKEVGTKVTDSFYCTSNYVPLLEAVWTHGIILHHYKLLPSDADVTGKAAEVTQMPALVHGHSVFSSEDQLITQRTSLMSDSHSVPSKCLLLSFLPTRPAVQTQVFVCLCLLFFRVCTFS